MMALAAYPLGLSCLFYDRTADTPGGQVGPIVTGAFDDAAALEQFARQVDVVTYDWENVPVAAAKAVARAGTNGPEGRRPAASIARAFFI